jgi:hypothetical protein
MTGVKWGQARRTNFGHLKQPQEFKQKAIKLFVKKKYPEEFRLHELHSD